MGRWFSGMWSCPGAHTGTLRDAEVMLGTQHPEQAVPFLQFHRDASACLPLSGFVSLSPLHTPVGATGSLFWSCAKSSCVDKEQGLPSRAGPQLCPPAPAQRGWIPAWPLPQTPHSAPRLEGRAANQPRSQSQRLEWLCHLGGTKAFSAPGQYCHSPAVPPGQRSPGTAPQSRLSAALRGTSASKSKAEVVFPLPSAIEAPPRALWRRGESFPRELQGGCWSPV